MNTVDDAFLFSAWTSAVAWPAWLESVQDKRDLWLANWHRAAVHPHEAARLAALPGPRRVLVLTEDWCGDALRSVPVIARAAEAAPMVELRCLDADDHREVLDRFLTHGGRAIPIALVQNERSELLGAWGPRPAPLQAQFRARRAELGPPTRETLVDFYTPIMAWYGKDGGRTIVQELLMLLERGGAPR
jgi:hypothetical protein